MTTTTEMKRFHFANQYGNVVSIDMDIREGQQLIHEMKQQGYYFCYAVWFSGK